MNIREYLEQNIDKEYLKFQSSLNVSNMLGVRSSKLLEIAKYARKKGYNIWCYTGYLYEDLLNISKTKKEVMDFLKQIDVLVDGRFVLEKKSFSCIFRGSTNQRVIDVPASLKAKKTVLIDKYIHNDTRSNRERTAGIYI